MREAHYQKGTMLHELSCYDEAIAEFEAAKGYLDSKDKILRGYKDAEDRVKEQDYLLAKDHLANGDRAAAIEFFEKASGYKDADECAGKLHYENAEAFIAELAYVEAAKEFALAGSFKDAKMRINQAYYLQAEKYAAETDTENAIAFYKKAGDFGDAQERLSAAYYSEGERLSQEQKYSKAYFAFIDAGINYLDADARAERLYDYIMNIEASGGRCSDSIKHHCAMFRCKKAGTSVLPENPGSYYCSEHYYVMKEAMDIYYKIVRYAK